AVRAAERWMIEHFDGSDGLGAIYPPMVYTIIALRCLGYADDSTEMKWAEKQLEDLVVDDEKMLRIQPCVSPIWDTALAMIALADAGLPEDHPGLVEAADWLLAHEIRQPGDWSLSTPGVEPSGWPFEYHNRFYPDLDDTAMVLMALRRTGRFNEEPCQRSVHRALRLLLAMQSRDHGWAAFDRDIDNKVLECVPFADHNAMLDPSCPDITGRVLEMLGQLGYRRGKPFIDDAIQFIFSHQEPEGCWFGRWGVNYIYGTWQVLLGLAAIGVDHRHPRVRKAVDWLKSVQQPTGAWGETCDSYLDRSLMGTGEPTPSQTGWAVAALVAVGEADSPEARRGVQYLLDTQLEDGSWDEGPFTGTGFPKVFYLRYTFYRLYFPLMAIARWRKATTAAGG
ncbi:MAG: squalene--hopene cyclase, partial [Planctomycetia bacterium]